MLKSTPNITKLPLDVIQKFSLLDSSPEHALVSDMKRKFHKLKQINEQYGEVRAFKYTDLVALVTRHQCATFRYEVLYLPTDRRRAKVNNSSSRSTLSRFR
jgi:hypothetical protein